MNEKLMALNDRINHGQAHKIVNQQYGSDMAQDTTRIHHHLELENEQRVRQGKKPLFFRHGKSTSTPEFHIKGGI